MLSAWTLALAVGFASAAGFGRDGGLVFAERFAPVVRLGLEAGVYVMPSA